jgi:hypothetical protein
MPATLVNTPQLPRRRKPAQHSRLVCSVHGPQPPGSTSASSLAKTTASSSTVLHTPTTKPAARADSSSSIGQISAVSSQAPVADPELMVPRQIYQPFLYRHPWQLARDIEKTSVHANTYL